MSRALVAAVFGRRRRGTLAEYVAQALENVQPPVLTDLSAGRG